MKTIWKVVGFIVFILVISFAGTIGKLVGKSTVGNYYEGKHDAEIKETLLKTSKEINSQLPIMVDDETRLDTTLVLDKQLYYKYTLVNIKPNEITGEWEYPPKIVPNVVRV